MFRIILAIYVAIILIAGVVTVINHFSTDTEAYNPQINIDKPSTIK